MPTPSKDNSLPIQGDNFGQARVIFRGLRFEVSGPSLTESLCAAGAIPQGCHIERIEGGPADVEIDVWTYRMISEARAKAEMLTLALSYEALARAVAPLVSLPKDEDHVLRRVSTEGYRPGGTPGSILLTYQHNAAN